MIIRDLTADDLGLVFCRFDEYNRKLHNKRANIGSLKKTLELCDASELIRIRAIFNEDEPDIFDQLVAICMAVIEIDMIGDYNRCAIAHLVVDEKYRCLNYARKLLEDTEEWAKDNGCQDMYMTTSRNRKSFMGYKNMNKYYYQKEL